MKIPIEILGSGGAFDYQEGNSSFLVDLEGFKLLIDCGSSVYARLKSRELVRNISAVAITHTHDDHIGSLSALIYDRYYLERLQTVIITSPEVAPSLEAYLAIAGHAPSQYVLMYSFVMKSPNIIIEPFDTSGRHKIDMKSCGFTITGKDSNIIYSGDIGCPISDLTNIRWADFPTNKTVVLHDATTHEVPAHCHYRKLGELAAAYAVFAYHHSKEEEDRILEGSDHLNTVSLY